MSFSQSDPLLGSSVRVTRSTTRTTTDGSNSPLPSVDTARSDGATSPRVHPSHSIASRRSTIPVADTTYQRLTPFEMRSLIHYDWVLSRIYALTHLPSQHVGMVKSLRTEAFDHGVDPLAGLFKDDSAAQAGLDDIHRMTKDRSSDDRPSLIEEGSIRSKARLLLLAVLRLYIKHSKLPVPILNAIMRSYSRLIGNHYLRLGLSSLPNAEPQIGLFVSRSFDESVLNDVGYSPLFGMTFIHVEINLNDTAATGRSRDLGSVEEENPVLNYGKRKRPGDVGPDKDGVKVVGGARKRQRSGRDAKAENREDEGPLELLLEGISRDSIGASHYMPGDPRSISVMLGPGRFVNHSDSSQLESRMPEQHLDDRPVKWCVETTLDWKYDLLRSSRFEEGTELYWTYWIGAGNTASEAFSKDIAVPQDDGKQAFWKPHILEEPV